MTGSGENLVRYRQFFSWKIPLKELSGAYRETPGRVILSGELYRSKKREFQ